MTRQNVCTRLCLLCFRFGLLLCCLLSLTLIVSNSGGYIGTSSIYHESLCLCHTARHLLL